MGKLHQIFYNLCSEFIHSHGRDMEALSALCKYKNANGMTNQMLDKWVEVLQVTQDEGAIKEAVREVQVMNNPAVTTYGKLLTHLATNKEFGLCEQLVLDMKTKNVNPSGLMLQITEQWKNIKELDNSLSVLNALHRETMGADATPPPRRLSELEVVAVANRFRRYKTLQDAKQTLEELKDVEQHITLYNILLEATTGDVTILWAIFKQLKEMGMTPSMHTFNTLITKLVKSQASRTTIAEVVQAMKDAGQKPDEITYNVLMQDRVQYRDKKGCLLFFELMKKNGVAPSTVTYNQMLKLAKDLRDKPMFDQTKQDLVNSNLVINTATEQLLEAPSNPKFWSHKPRF